MIYLWMGIFVLGMNVAPALMPPTWIVLAFFFSHFHLDLFPTVLIGATAATLGRVTLYYLSKRYLRRFLPEQFNQNYQGLGKFIQKNQKLTIPLVVTYAFLPIPSNNVFIIAGLADLNIKVIALSFFFGRLASYTFWVSVSSQISTHLETVFEGHLSNWSGFIVEILSLLVVLLIGRINWSKILASRKFTR